MHDFQILGTGHVCFIQTVGEMKPTIQLGPMFLDVRRDFRYGDVDTFVHVPELLRNMERLVRMVVAYPQEKRMVVTMAVGEVTYRIILVAYPLAPDVFNRPGIRPDVILEVAVPAAFSDAFQVFAF